jgi:hypothetical protein
MNETSIVDELLSSNPLMRVRDKSKVETLLKSLISGGMEKLQERPYKTFLWTNVTVYIYIKNRVLIDSEASLMNI